MPLLGPHVRSVAPEHPRPPCASAMGRGATPERERHSAGGEFAVFARDVCSRRDVSCDHSSWSMLRPGGLLGGCFRRFGQRVAGGDEARLLAHRMPIEQWERRCLVCWTPCCRGKGWCCPPGSRLATCGGGLAGAPWRDRLEGMSAFARVTEGFGVGVGVHVRPEVWVFWGWVPAALEYPHVMCM